MILTIDPGSPAAQASLLIGDLLIGTEKASFTATADLADAIAEAGSGHFTLRFLRGDHTREREVVISLESHLTREAARFEFGLRPLPQSRERVLNPCLKAARASNWWTRRRWRTLC